MANYLPRLPFMPVWLAVCFLLLAVLGAQADDPAAVVGSKHDLSTSGTGPVKSSVSDACVFCHGSHLPASSAAQTPLWNKNLPGVTYDVYSSTTYNVAPGSFSSNTSKLCLSCHDGTIAPGMTLTRPNIITSGGMKGRKMGQADLTQEHPVGIQPVDDGQLASSLFQNPPVSSDSAVQLRNGRVECITCHTPHEPARDTIAENFLVRSNSDGALCLACHDPGRPQPNDLHQWELSAHATAPHATPSQSKFGSYGTVAANACENCHVSHAGTGPPTARLLRAREEKTCLICHEGASLSPSVPDIGRELTKIYTHPTATVGGVHDPASDGVPVANNRHAECSDCHNPHAAGFPGTTVPPQVSSALQGTSGFDGTVALHPAVNEYEVCFKCHADSPNKPQATLGYGTYGRTSRRQTDQVAPDPFNVRLEFESAVSRHNVSNPRGGTGSNNLVPSLRPSVRLPHSGAGRALDTSSYIACTDCHSNDAARKFGGAGPNGPHGSRNEHLLTQPYPMNSPPPFPGGNIGGVNYVSGAVTYPLCNLCHYIDRGGNANAILNDGTFKHDVHVRGADVSCATCHDPHGIQGGNLTNNPSLINFDLSIVGPSSFNQGPRYEQTSINSGSCYLTCHGKDHNPLSY